jgi:hypothetical protein
VRPGWTHGTLARTSSDQTCPLRCPVRPLESNSGLLWTNPGHSFYYVLPLGLLLTRRLDTQRDGPPVRSVRALTGPPDPARDPPVATHLLPLPRRLVDQKRISFPFLYRIRDFLYSLPPVIYRQFPGSAPCRGDSHCPLICPVCGYRRSAPSPPSPARPPRVIIHRPAPVR